MNRPGYACGKVILLGEHAVVHGVPAIAVGIDRGAKAGCAPSTDGTTRLRIQPWGLTVTVEGQSPENANDVARAFRALIQATAERAAPALRNVAVTVEAEAELPPGGGLGCSAALGVAVARALDPAVNASTAAERAMAWERIFHGNPSGIDAAVAAHGGCVAFSRAEGPRPLLVGTELLLCIGHSGAASSTKSMVEAVARLRERQPDTVTRAFAKVGDLVALARRALEDGDLHALGRLLDENQAVLEGLHVSSPDLERLCELARSAGALGAKLTGAGGGGCAVALVADESARDRVLAAWRARGYDAFGTRVRDGGLRRELGGPRLEATP